MIPKIVLFFFALLVSFPMISQTDGINYKAVIKDGSGNVIVNDLIVVQFQILQGAGMTNVYQETHTPTTDANGMAIMNIGAGSTSDVFADIDWGSDNHYLNVQINTGGGLTNMGTTQFMSVPYAYKSKSSNIATEAAIANSLTLKSGTTDQFNITYEATGDKLQVSEVGMAGNVLEISNGELYLPQYAGGTEDANLKIDVNGKLVKEAPAAEQSFNLFDFSIETPFSGAIRLDRGIKFEDGITITGLKAWLLDNEPGTNTGIMNTPFVSLHRLSKSDQNASVEEIFRVEGANTSTAVFQEFTTTTVIASRNIVDNANFIYLLRLFICDNCDFRQVTVTE